MPVIKERQTITDLAVQYAGDASAAPDIALANGLSITSDVMPGTEIIIPNVVNQEVVLFFKINKQAPAMKTDKANKPGGIGYMQMGTDFKVS